MRFFFFLSNYIQLSIVSNGFWFYWLLFVLWLHAKCGMKKKIESRRTHATNATPSALLPIATRNSQHITSITYFLLREYNKSIRAYETTFIFCFSMAWMPKFIAVAEDYTIHRLPKNILESHAGAVGSAGVHRSQPPPSSSLQMNAVLMRT